MRTADFDFNLPSDLIAQVPAKKRDESRLLVLHRDSGAVEHRRFPDLLPHLRAGDVLVLNNSRVIPARLHGSNKKTSGQFEILLLEELSTNDWWVMLRPGKRARTGTQIAVHDRRGQPSDVHATVLEKNSDGHYRLRFDGAENILDSLDALGAVPLPPYIERGASGPTDEDRERYQTVFAQFAGSVAAPTAGLHFTGPLLDEIRSRGIEICFVTLHVGAGTFAPVKSDSPSGHVLHEERYELSEETARAINEAKRTGRRVIAVGTTSVRVLETIALANDGRLVAGKGRTRIFIYPPFHFRIVDALLTNFHLPCSTLLMLVSAFASTDDTRGREVVLSAYAEAIRERYRFFSYGDAMLVV